MANAGRHGVLVKSAVVMERTGQADAVALDKTGTLTEGTPGSPTSARWTAPGAAAELLRLAAAAEHPSEHLLARAVLDAARAAAWTFPLPRFRLRPARGDRTGRRTHPGRRLQRCRRSRRHGQ